MKKDKIIEILKEKLDDEREYEFVYNDESGDFEGASFFSSMESQRAFEKKWELVNKNESNQKCI